MLYREERQLVQGTKKQQKKTEFKLNTTAAATAYVKSGDGHDAELRGHPSSFHLSYLK